MRKKRLLQYRWFTAFFLAIFLLSCATTKIPDSKKGTQVNVTAEQGAVLTSAAAQPVKKKKKKATAWQVVKPPTISPPVKKKRKAPPHVQTRIKESSHLKNRTDSDEYVVLNFEGVDLDFVLQYITEIIGMNYILSTAVKGKITIQTYKKIPKSDLFSILHTILEINGLTTVKQNNYYKIIPLSNAQKYPIETVIGNNYEDIPNEDIPVTQIVMLDNMPVKDAERLIKPFVSKGGNIIAHADLNVLVINDLQSNIRRMMKIINVMDKQLNQGGVMHGEQVYVYYLENIEANDIAKVLNQVFTAKKGKKNLNVPLRINQQAKSNKAGFRGRVAPATGGGAANAASLEGDLKIVSDEINNALIIKASQKDYKTVLNLVKKLDIIPRQVLIEILVVDVTLDEGTSMGVEWALAAASKNFEIAPGQHVMGTSSLGASRQEGQWFFGPDTLPFDSALGGFNYLIQGASDKFLAFIKAAANHSKAKVISSPHILAVNNKEATIEIVDEVPIPRNTIGTGTVPSQSGFDFKTAGTKLTVKPKINKRGLVNMEISQEVSEPGSSSPDSSIPPRFKKRTAKTNAIVRSGQTIVIGGLIKETLNESSSGIPYLMDIPYLGVLFGTKGSSITRSELIMMITPHVILTEEDAMRVSEEFSSHLRKTKTLKKYMQSYKGEKPLF